MLKRILKSVPCAAFSGLATLLVSLEPAGAANGLGQPLPGQIGLQLAATPVAREIHQFYDFTNLIIIAIPSFKLLMLQYSYPKPDLTIKAIGNAWFWEHQYPDHGNFLVTSSVLSDEEVNARIKKGIATPRLLAVDNEIAVPVDKVVLVLVTSNDVIHAWTIPSFGSKTDAVPGRVTATWFKAEQEGIYYGQCSELCGINHAYMPIAVRVVSETVFNDWAAAMKAKDKKKAKEILDKVALEQAGVTNVVQLESSTAN